MYKHTILRCCFLLLSLLIFKKHRILIEKAAKLDDCHRNSKEKINNNIIIKKY